EQLVQPLALLSYPRRRLLDEQNQKLHGAKQPQHLVALRQKTALAEFAIVVGAELYRKRAGDAIEQVRFLLRYFDWFQLDSVNNGAHGSNSFLTLLNSPNIRRR